MDEMAKQRAMAQALMGGGGGGQAIGAAPQDYAIQQQMMGDVAQAEKQREYINYMTQMLQQQQAAEAAKRQQAQGAPGTSFMFEPIFGKPGAY